MGQKAKSSATFIYQFLSAEQFPLGNSHLAHPWLTFETDTADAFATIYPRTSSDKFIEKEPQDVGVAAHAHKCSINKPGTLYLRDSVTATRKKDFFAMSSGKKGCRAEAPLAKRSVIGNLQALSRRQPSAPLAGQASRGDLVKFKTGSTASKLGLQGLVVDSWSKSRSNEAVLLLALVSREREKSMGYLSAKTHNGIEYFIYPGLQFLAFQRAVMPQERTGLDAQLLYVWPSTFERERRAMAQTLGLAYEEASAENRPSQSFTDLVQCASETSRTPRLQNTTPPSVSAVVASTVVTKQDGHTLLSANLIAEPTISELSNFAEEIRKLSSLSAEGASSLSARAALYTSLGKAMTPSMQPGVLVAAPVENIQVLFISSLPEEMSPARQASVKALIQKQLALDKNLRFVNFVESLPDANVETSNWRHGAGDIEVRHVQYNDGDQT